MPKNNPWRASMRPNKKQKHNQQHHTASTAPAAAAYHRVCDTRTRRAASKWQKCWKKLAEHTKTDCSASYALCGAVHAALDTATHSVCKHSKRHTVYNRTALTSDTHRHHPTPYGFFQQHQPQKKQQQQQMLATVSVCWRPCVCVYAVVRQCSIVCGWGVYSFVHRLNTYQRASQPAERSYGKFQRSDTNGE